MSAEAPDGRMVWPQGARYVRFIRTNRWEFVLLVGLPFLWGGIWATASWATTRALVEWDALYLFSTKIYIPWVLWTSFFVLPLIVFYRAVRRSGRPMLILVWEFTTVLLVAEFILGIVYPALGEVGLYRYPGSNFTYEFASTLVRGVVFVWFARQAMKFSFGHGLLLAALSVSLGYQHYLFQVQSSYGVEYILLFATGLTLRFVTVNCQAIALVHFNSMTVGGQIRWLAVLLGFVVAGLVHGSTRIDPFEQLHLRFMWQIARENAIFITLFYGAILGTAYLLGGETDESPDDDPAEIGDNLAREPE